MILIKEEEQLLDQDFRKRAIDYFNDVENSERKKEAKRRHDIYKDKVKQYVQDQMTEESSDNTIREEIKNRTSNISFCRKIIEKKAQVYKEGVRREILGQDGKQNKEEQKKYEKLFDILNLDSTMKKVNRYVELFKNTLVQVMAYRDYSQEDEKWNMKLQVLAPYLFDVIADQSDPELMRVVVFSYYTDNIMEYKPEGESGNREAPVSEGGKVPVQEKEYIWWSNRYHFTTNEKGEIIVGKQEKDLKNPIQRLPFIDFSVDKDGKFWAEGGEDLIDGTILLNILLTDLYYIAKYQGMGTGYLFGKGVPEYMKVGASAFITLEVQEGDPTPQMGYASSNPPISDHLALIEQYVAFLLSTNNLEPGTVNSKLSGATANSGIQDMVRRAEMTEDIEDQREGYRDKEPELVTISRLWHNDLLDREVSNEKFSKIGKLGEDSGLVIKFNRPEVFKTEKEELEILEKRRDLGIDSIIDSIMRDNSDLTREDAIEKYRQVLEEKLMQSNERLKFGLVNDNKDRQDNIQSGSRDNEE